MKSEPYTRKDLAELKALAEVATEGPWAACSAKGLYFVSSEYGPICSVGPYDERNTDFIAASREAVPRLIKQVERLEKAIRKALGEMGDRPSQEKDGFEATAKRTLRAALNARETEQP